MKTKATENKINIVSVTSEVEQQNLQEEAVGFLEQKLIVYISIQNLLMN
ncbi:MAG: hypothetical protein L6V95_04690 [Candidatus Melainabacteria bacterium]|nr:MAG: hypothetical protein L6V95_04690 [Candidatus Melainabacteria bacterium]